MTSDKNKEYVCSKREEIPVKVFFLMSFIITLQVLKVKNRLVNSYVVSFIFYGQLKFVQFAGNDPFPVNVIG